MSWLRESERSWVERFGCRVMRAGPIPQHVAFIMDGNRRYARKIGLGDTTLGHSKGFDRLAKTMEWCRDLGITEVTVYAFSIENFKRSKEEVEGIMDLAREKFKELLNDKEKMREHGVKFQFFGNLTLLPVDIQELLAKISLFSKDFDNDVCETLISGCLDTRGSPDPDLLIRTSGELRFSDFMLWQCAHSCVYFDNVLWPEFSFWNLCYAILHYQRNFADIQAFRREIQNGSMETSSESIKRRENFLRILNEEKTTKICDMASE